MALGGLGLLPTVGASYAVVRCVHCPLVLRRQRREEERRRCEMEDYLARHALGQPGWRERRNTLRPARSTAPAALPRRSASAPDLEIAEESPVPAASKKGGGGHWPPHLNT